MELPKAIIKESYNDFLQGKEVEATIAVADRKIEKGMHVMGYHDSIATETPVAVPKEKQAQYIGVEGIVTDTRDFVTGESDEQYITIVKL